MMGQNMVSRVIRRPFWASLLTSTLILTILGSYGFSSMGAQSSMAAPAQIKVGGTVSNVDVSGALWSCNYNPLSPSGLGPLNGTMYEPLVYVNGLTSAFTPWLATSWYWTNGNRTLVANIRRGVLWNDGKPFGPADVVFTFNELKKFPAADAYAVWEALSSVTQRGNSVIFNFKRPSVPQFYNVAGQQVIVPRHIFASMKNPTTYTNKNPVATGPFMLSSCSPQNITEVRNPHYWQAGKPYLSKLLQPAFLDNQPGNLYLAEGKANWGCQYIPNTQTYYVARNPSHFHYWYPASNSHVVIFPNLTVWPLTMPLVRQALSYAVDRAKISRLGVYGYLKPANQSGIVLPTFKSWFDSALARRYNYTFNPAKATALLVKAGFKRGSNGIFRWRNGKPLSLSIINEGGFTDWVAEVEILRTNLRQVGIDLKVQNITDNAYTPDRSNGRYQLAFGTPASVGSSPYYEYRSLLHSANTAPIGQTASGNYERFRNARVDALLNQFDATKNPAAQHRIINQIQAIMLEQVPVIPVLNAVNWSQWDDSQITGWATPQNPYAPPGGCNNLDMEYVLLHLHLR
jgi:peptide/nickel transport system substrate-binding protein